MLSLGTLLLLPLLPENPNLLAGPGTYLPPCCCACCRGHTLFIGHISPSRDHPTCRTQPALWSHPGSNHTASWSGPQPHRPKCSLSGPMPNFSAVPGVQEGVKLTCREKRS